MKRWILLAVLAGAVPVAGEDLEERRLERDALGARGAAALRVSRHTVQRLAARGWAPRASIPGAGAVVEALLDDLDRQWKSVTDEQWVKLRRQAHDAVDRLEKEAGIR